MKKLRFALAFLALSFAAGSRAKTANAFVYCPGILTAPHWNCAFTGRLCNDTHGCVYDCYYLDDNNNYDPSHDQMGWCITPSEGGGGGEE